VAWRIYFNKDSQTLKPKDTVKKKMGIQEVIMGVTPCSEPLLPSLHKCSKKWHKIGFELAELIPIFVTAAKKYLLAGEAMPPRSSFLSSFSLEAA
jgi:hypothetical protein